MKVGAKRHRQPTLPNGAKLPPYEVDGDPDEMA